MMKKDTTLTIRSVNISEEKGTIKKPVSSIELTKNGVGGDAHAGPWHRQVSMIGVESLRNFENIAGRQIAFGEFAENITVEGMDLTKVHLLDRFQNGQVELEVTQIGKQCHGDNCAIFREVGKCAMPKEGIFCRVLKTGQLKAGDKFTYIPRTFRVLILTLSDRAFRGEYEDRSGKYINQELKSFLSQKLPNHTITNKIIPDEPEILQEHIQHAKTSETDVLITTGGTGIGTRDITPETVLPFIDKHLHGIMEMVRVKYGANNPNALLSRSIAGLSGKMLVYTLPGSSKAVKEYLEVILPTIKHSFFMVHDLDLHG